MNWFREDGGARLSDTLVLGVVITLLMSTCVLLVFRALADSIQQRGTDTTIISTHDSNRDYDILLAYIFDTAGREVDETADTYIRTVDDYRARVARGVVENISLITALRALIHDAPDTSTQKYVQELNNLNDTAQEHRITTIQYVSNDTFLVKAVIDEYNLKRYTAFEKVIRWLGYEPTVDTLGDLREDSYQLRVAIAKLYEKIASVR